MCEYTDILFMNVLEGYNLVVIVCFYKLQFAWVMK